MGSQNARAVFRVVAPILVAACGTALPPRISSISLRDDAPDLSLRGVAFARLAEGRVVARGNAERLDYRRAGARMEAVRGGAGIPPGPGNRVPPVGPGGFRPRRVRGENAKRTGVPSGGGPGHHPPAGTRRN